MRVSVDSSGELIGSSVARSSGHARLDSAAMHAIARCKFTPARNAAGVAVAGTALIKFDWRLEEPVMPDPWPVLRRANVAAFSATADLATIPFSTPTRANAEQRVKILAAMQKESAIQTGCTSIETISAAPVPLEHTYDLPFDPKTGKPLRFLREFWTATQCDKTMTYMLRMRLSETEGVSYTMWPLPDRSAPPVR